jgi:4'-phosphopantetheinyl transferase
MTSQRSLAAPLAAPSAADVHVWRISLDRRAEEIEAMERLLSDDELARADRFDFLAERTHFVAARGAMRIVLAAYLAISPRALDFEYSPEGKPRLNSASPVTSLRFNLAHSHRLGLLAVNTSGEVGLDVELRRHVDSSRMVAERLFSAEECAHLAAAPDEVERDRLFLTYWTRKESVLKLTGTGLRQPLDSINVAWHGAVSPLLVVADGSANMRNVRVRDLEPQPGYAAAVAVEGDKHDWSVVWRTYPPGERPDGVTSSH